MLLVPCSVRAQGGAVIRETLTVGPQPPPPVVANLEIDLDGTLSWNGTAVDRKTMQGYITEQVSEDPQPEVHISVDKFAKYAEVAETLADLQGRGLKKIGFINNDLF